MAVQTTEEFKSAGSTSYTTAIEKLKDTDLKVRIGGALQTYVASSPGSGQYTVTNNPTTIVLGAAAGAEVHIYRETDVNTAAASFAPGSSIRAVDLNAIHDMARFAAVEHRNKIITADIKEGQITSTEIKNDTIVNEDINTSANIDNSKLADGLLKAGLTINSDNIVNGSIVDADISNTANIEGTKLKDDSVTLAKLGNGPLPGDITVNSTNIVNGSIVDADINSSAAISHSKLNLNIVDSDINSGANIAGSKLANDSVPLTKLGGGTLPTDITVASTNIVDGTITNIDINNSAAIAFTKLETGNLPSNITVNSANIVNGSIVNEDINASANIAGSKLANDSVTLDKLGAGALPTDITVASANIVDGSIVNADIKSDANIAGSKLADDSVTLAKLGSGALPTDITVASANVVNGTLVNADINASAEIEGSKLLNDSVSLDKIGSGALPTDITVNNSNIVTGTLDGRYFTETELTSGTALDGRYFTETELLNGALDGRYFTETEAEANFLRQDSSETIASGVTWSSTDSKVATTAAIDARIIDLLDDTGGFVPLANETSFPTANPDINNGAGTVVSVKAVSTNLTPSSGTVTIANGAGTGNTVTITGVTGVIPQGFGMILETTSTLHTYAFHRLQAKATEVNTVATNIGNVIACGQNLTDIENFADLYQISTSAPTTRADGTSLTVGDLWFDSSSNQVMMVYDGSPGDGFSPITPDQATITAINSVSGHVTFQEDLGLITDAVNTGSGNNSINTVGANIANVNTTATNIAKIQTVADDLNETTSEIDTVATNIANVNTVGNNISNVNAVANNSSNINSAVSNASNINSAVSNASNINAAVSNATNINTVAGINSNVTTVAGSISNVNTAATNIASINTTAASIANVNNFTDKYQVASSDPSTDGGGNALAAGDLYFNTSANELKVYTGNAWQGGVTATGNFASVTGNIFTGDNKYNDNVKLKLGSSSDLEIFHDGNQSVIKDVGTGQLLISGQNTIAFTNSAGNENYARMLRDGAVELFYNGTKMFQTTSTGATITGLMTATTIDGSAGDNLQLDFGTL